MKKSLISLLSALTFVALAVAQTPNGKMAPAASKPESAKSEKHEKHRLKRREKFTSQTSMMTDKAGCLIVNQGQPGQICVYDIEQIPHYTATTPAIYISPANGESLILYSSAGHKFHVNKFLAHTAGCPSQPFQQVFLDSTETPSRAVVTTDVARKTAVGCEYKMNIRVKVDGGVEKWDPVIIIGP